MSDGDPAPIQPIASAKEESTVADRLPARMPEQWVRQVKNATSAQKSAWLPIVAGSSVIAAIIGAGASIFTAQITGRENRDLEITKAQMLRDSDAVKQRNEAYEQLGRNLDGLADGLAGTRILVASLGPNRSGRGIPQRISTELKRIGQAALSVRESEASPLVAKAIVDQIDRILAMFLPALGNAQADQTKLNDFLRLIDPTEKQIQAARLSLNRIIEVLSGAAADVGQPAVAK